MEIKFTKYSDSLVPAIVQDAVTHKVLMLGFMNAEAYDTTIATKRVTFFSRSTNCLWVKGETSGNFLSVNEILADCDSDTLLIKATPNGPVCHNGTDTCFNEKNDPENFLLELESVIKARRENPVKGSYISTLFSRGLNRIAQKVGEEAVELVIESKDKNDEAFIQESADLLFHFLVLLAEKRIEFTDVIAKLKDRKRIRKKQESRKMDLNRT